MTQTEEAHPVGLVGEGRAAELMAGALTVEHVVVGASRQGLPTLPSVVVDAEAVGSDALLGVVHALRQALPLTDVIVWAPQADSALVRSLLHAGIADVVLSDAAEDLLAAVRRLLSSRKSRPRLQGREIRRERASRYEGMVGRNAQMWDAFELCERIAGTDASVLIVAEAGTGKEMLARAIHRRSRRAGRFVPVSCASLPEQFGEGEIFSDESDDAPGSSHEVLAILRHAHRGTLFLDDVAAIPLAAQATLLRLLTENAEGRADSALELRVLAAARTSPEDAVRDGRLRVDLFYWLDAVRLHLPALRERPEDITFLFGHFVKKLCKHYAVRNPDISEGFLDALQRHDWPGNVRQLENFAERLVLAGRRRQLTRGDFHRYVSPSVPPQEATASGDGGAFHIDPSTTLSDNLDPVVAAIEAAYLAALLRRFHGRISESAEHAGMSRRTLLRKIKLHGIDKREYRAGS